MLQHLLDHPRQKWAAVVVLCVLVVGGVFGAQLVKLVKVQAAYTIGNSVRFNSASTQYLYRNMGATGDRQKFTFSTWVKPAGFGAYRDLFSAYDDVSTTDDKLLNVSLTDGNAIQVTTYSKAYVRTSALLRDPAAWTHVVVSFDTTKDDSAERVKVFIDGVQQTSFSVNTPPAKNDNLAATLTGLQQRVGALNFTAGPEYMNGYMADTYFIDGAQVSPECFGATDANGYWRPKAYTTGTPCAAYGTNGFHLDYSNGSALGTDTSGNGNTFTNNNLLSTDQVVDTPTNNFATLNAVQTPVSTLGGGNLQATGVTGWRTNYSTISAPSGKYYFEVTATAVSNAARLLITAARADYAAAIVGSGASNPGASPYGWSMVFGGVGGTAKQNNGVDGMLSDQTLVVNDVMQIAVDVDNGKLWFGRNNSWVEGDPAAGTTPSYSNLSGPIVLGVTLNHTGTNSVTVNFGQGGTTTVTYDSASGGYFRYTPPSGFKALSTANLPEPAVTVPKNYFDAFVYAGQGTTTSQTAKKTIVFVATSTTSWVVPSDWNSSNNTIEVIGAGGGGGAGFYYTSGCCGGGGGGGGGGGAYSKVANQALPAGSAVTIKVGAGGSGGVGNPSSDGVTGTDTYVCNSTSNCASISDSAVVVGAKGGTGGGTGTGLYNVASPLSQGTAGVGGVAADGVGSVKYSGGSATRAVVNTIGGSGGGGAAGPDGAGAAGAAAPTSNNGYRGGGGGAANSGSVGSGQVGGNGRGGTGGGAAGSPGGAGTVGGGGGGATNGNVSAANLTGGNGGQEPVWVSWGPGGGGGGGAYNDTLGGPVGLGGSSNGYGGGGGGGSGDGLSTQTRGGAGTGGIIVATYTPANANYTGFTPDLVWLKDLSATNSHGIFDSVRQVFAYWSSDKASNSWEVGGFGKALTSFITTGFTLGSDSNFNTFGNDYISWMWDESTTAGIDVVTYTGNNTSNRIIAHSLGKRPDFVIVKRRDATDDPYVWSSSFKDATTFAKLDSTAATSTTAAPWGTGSFTSTGFMVTNSAGNYLSLNDPGANYVAYLFATTTGFSDFGTYTGNGSTDGPFVYTGFKPRFLMVKSTGSGATNWRILDTARDIANPAVRGVYPNVTDVEDTSNNSVDILSNGFKPRTTGGGTNSSAEQYFYAAFAEQPLQQSGQAYNLTIASSTRFVSGNSTYLSRNYTGSTRTDAKKGTISFWVKRGPSSSQGRVMQGYDGSSTSGSAIDFSNSTANALWFQFGGASAIAVETSALFRDPATWHHMVAAWDTTQANSSDRVSIYINGIKVTSFASATYPSQNASAQFFYPNANNTIGALYTGGSTYFDGYLSDFYGIDGQALDPTYFAEADTNGYWRPKTYSGTYGTNGFHLPLLATSTASIGTDTSGNGNFFASSGFTAASGANTGDSVKDSPTTNYATLSPTTPDGGTYSIGNLKFLGPAAYRIAKATMEVPPTGKWAFAVTIKNAPFTPRTTDTGYNRFGVTFSSYQANAGAGYTALTNSLLFGDNGYYLNFTGTQVDSSATIANGDVIELLLDRDANTFAYKRSGSTLASGTMGAAAGTALTPAILSYDGTYGIMQFDFGQNGYVPSDSNYKTLSTANLPTPTVTKPSTYFDAIPYVGQGTTTSVLAKKVVFLTSGTSWTVPPDWNSSNNTVEVIGGGGGGGDSAAGSGGSGGGGGGAYAVKSTISLTPGNTVTYQVGAGGTHNGSGGTDTFFNRTSGSANTCADTVSVCAKGGADGAGTRAGGTAASSVGDFAFSGGSGNGAGSRGGGGGGGAAGPNGAGAAGGSGAIPSADPGGGGGGGGASGGSAGSNGSGTPGIGGAGGNNFGGAGSGAGGSSSNGTAGTKGGGGGGGGGNQRNGAAGGDGVEWVNPSTNTKVGAGGGGGGGASATSGGCPSACTGAAGGSYGGGGGGGGYSEAGSGTTQSGGNGAQGVIIITYVPTTTLTPDIVWIKDRTSTNSHGIFDTSRADYPFLSSNNATTESASSTALYAFITNGFSIGSSTAFNTIGNNYISWMWKKSPTTSGVDIVTYTGTGATQTISHSLGKRPAFVLVKRRDSTTSNDGYMWMSVFNGQTTYALLDSTAGTTTSSSPFSSFTSTGFTVSSTLGGAGSTYVAYLFATTTGFSDFGTYTGNGSADGPFIYTGFKPKWILTFRTSGATWVQVDSAQSTYNPLGQYVPTNSTAVQGSATSLDLLSNGYKIRTTDGSWNTSGHMYIYATFAEQPFKYSSQPATLNFVQAVAFLLGMTF